MEVQYTQAAYVSVLVVWTLHDTGNDARGVSHLRPRH